MPILTLKDGTLHLGLNQNSSQRKRRKWGMKRNLIPSEKENKSKADHINSKTYSATATERKPVNHKDSKAEAGNAEDGNPSCGDAIGSLVPSAPRHQPHFFTNEASASSLSHSSGAATAEIKPTALHFTREQRKKGVGVAEGDFRAVPKESQTHCFCCPVL